MVAKALVLAAALAVAVALPSPGDNVEIVEAQPIAYAQERGDLLGLASGGWGSKPLISVGWAPQQQSSGWGWAPKVRYLKFSIPIPVLPRIKFGVKGGLRLHASIQQPKGWGWSR
ncbi:hypothetical protein Ocin01_04654 [Orchesella cincta]|uniref:Uncharacterized protein n=1 Tax=Orchesella cincta TaxID=48709 RepID=A0A1D2N9V2_ORCCI|nr:hypothetical protein Ocin01_04654 [Orchesella cincta]